MFFLLQKENTRLELEIFIIKSILDNQRHMDEYIFCTLEDFINQEIEFKKDIKKSIPVGTIDFVEAWLKQYWNINKINPIEVPVCLRKEEFLKRKYSIVRKEDIPQKGRIFFKDASQLKKFSGEIECERFFTDEIWMPSKRKFDTTLRLDPTHLYQVSEIVNIESEYRVYIQENEIEAIAHYNGSPYILPDMKLLQKMINIYSTQKDCPKAYTMDIAINKRGTFLLEVHPWVSVGLYNSLWNRKLLYAYRDGLDYVLNFNTEQTEYKGE